jgi:hypothetical protein
VPVIILPPWPIVWSLPCTLLLLKTHGFHTPLLLKLMTFSLPTLSLQTDPFSLGFQLLSLQLLFFKAQAFPFTLQSDLLVTLAPFNIPLTFSLMI